MNPPQWSCGLMRYSPIGVDCQRWRDIGSTSVRSPTFHNFVKVALTKNTKKRPNAEKLLQHPFFQSDMNKRLALELLQKVSNPQHNFTEFEADEDGVRDNCNPDQIQRDNEISAGRPLTPHYADVSRAWDIMDIMNNIETVHSCDTDADWTKGSVFEETDRQCENYLTCMFLNRLMISAHKNFYEQEQKGLPNLQSLDMFQPASVGTQAKAPISSDFLMPVRSGLESQLYVPIYVKNMRRAGTPQQCNNRLNCERECQRCLLQARKQRLTGTAIFKMSLRQKPEIYDPTEATDLRSRREGIGQEVTNLHYTTQILDG
ncbi:unnamed protein product, partial [Timema podura]|nr:unnamed protein product [Timema podura]